MKGGEGVRERKLLNTTRSWSHHVSADLVNARLSSQKADVSRDAVVMSRDAISV